MSKYDPLRDYLRAQTGEAVTLTFTDLDAMMKLPASAKRFDFWWSNDDVKTTVHAQCRAWQDAGYEAQSNVRGKKVTFRKIGTARSTP